MEKMYIQIEKMYPLTQLFNFFGNFFNFCAKIIYLKNDFLN